MTPIGKFRRQIAIAGAAISGAIAAGLSGCFHPVADDPPAQPVKPDWNTEFERWAEDLRDLHNAARQGESKRIGRAIGDLSIDARLNLIATEHAVWMARWGMLRHSHLSRVGCSSVAENIASGQANPPAVFFAWLDSTRHRRNILNGKYSNVGFGKAVGSRGKLYWCAIFCG